MLARPLKLPEMPTDVTCTDGPHATISPYRNSSDTVYVWGLVPVYAAGGSERCVPETITST